MVQTIITESVMCNKWAQRIMYTLQTEILPKASESYEEMLDLLFKIKSDMVEVSILLDDIRTGDIDLGSP